MKPEVYMTYRWLSNKGPHDSPLLDKIKTVRHFKKQSPSFMGFPSWYCFLGDFLKDDE